MTIGTEQIARFKPGENLPVYATVAGDILPGRFVTISGRNTKNAYVGAHTGAGLWAHGVSQRRAIGGVTDHRGGTELARRGAVARCESGAAVAIGDPVKSDATGRAITQGGTGVILGYALQAATAAGQIIDVDLI
jgi:hypothetical protein